MSAVSAEATSKDLISSRPEVRPLRNVYEAMIDWLIANPTGKNSELAEAFGYTPSYVSRLTSSDIFQARLRERKAEVVNPLLTASVEDRMNGVVALSLEIIQEELERGHSVPLAMKSIEVIGKANRYGAKVAGINNGIVNNYVVTVPEKSRSAEEWVQNHSPNLGITIDQE